MSTINEALTEAKNIISPDASTYLLTEVLKKNSAYLINHSDDTLSQAQYEQYCQWTQRHKAGEPIAYITGHQAFWHLDLKVSPDTLIPRPETELLVEKALQLVTNPDTHVLDLGTGSGAIALALGAERPQWHITAVDKSPAALSIAKANAKHYKLHHIKFIESDWFSKLHGQQFSLIVANPPYIAPNDSHLADLIHEPIGALVAENLGLSDITYIIKHAQPYLLPQGILMLEHGFSQGRAVMDLMHQANYCHVHQFYDTNQHPRVVSGQMP